MRQPALRCSCRLSGQCLGSCLWTLCRSSFPWYGDEAVVLENGRIGRWLEEDVVAVGLAFKVADPGAFWYFPRLTCMRHPFVLYLHV